jgi:hypothetical protein
VVEGDALDFRAAEIDADAERYGRQTVNVTTVRAAAWAPAADAVPTPLPFKT